MCTVKFGSALSSNIYLISSICTNLTNSVHSCSCEHSHSIQIPCYIQSTILESIQTVHLERLKTVPDHEAETKKKPPQITADYFSLKQPYVFVWLLALSSHTKSSLIFIFNQKSIWSFNNISNLFYVRTTMKKCRCVLPMTVREKRKRKFPSLLTISQV